jgi:hypothetical protein
MLKFVQQQYRPGERMAVLTLTGPLRVLQDFTSDPQILQAALQRYRPVPQEFSSTARATTGDRGPISASAAAASLDPAALSFCGRQARRTTASALTPGLVPERWRPFSNAQLAIDSFAGAEVAYAQDQRVQLTLSAQNSLARILGGLAGRKTMIVGDRSVSLNVDS